MRKWETEQTPKGRCNNIIWQELCRRGGGGAHWIFLEHCKYAQVRNWVMKLLRAPSVKMFSYLSESFEHFT